MDEKNIVWQVKQEIKAMKLANLFCRTETARQWAWERSEVNILQIVSELVEATKEKT